MNIRDNVYDLSVELIKKQDAKNLQIVTEIDVKQSGRAYSLLRLAFAFLNCDRTKQAVKILGMQFSFSF